MAALALSSQYRRLFFAALAIFVLAGLTGASMRFGLIYGFPWGLQYANVRHAHSHVMYFGWVTPALMALIAAQLPAVTDRPMSARFKWPIVMAILGGLLAYVPFLLYGYAPATLAGRQIPLSVVAAGFNVIGWYWFIWVYWQETRASTGSASRSTSSAPPEPVEGRPVKASPVEAPPEPVEGRAARNYPLQMWDGALVFLAFASLGAWGLAVITRLDVQDLFWSLAMTHIFLDTFSYGWVLLGVLGVAYVTRPQLAGNQLARWSINLVVIGMPVIFLLGMPLHVVPATVRWLGALGALLVALGLLGHVWVLGNWDASASLSMSLGTGNGELESKNWKLKTENWKRWRLPLFFLALTAVTLAVTGIPAVARWAAVSGVRVLHLHWMLLGFVTLGLVTGAQEKWGRMAVAGWRWMAAAIVILIASLIPLTTLWPAALRGEWTRYFAAVAALGPALAALVMMIQSSGTRKEI